MNIECKVSGNLSSECFDVGRDIARSRQDQNKYRRTIADCEREIRLGTKRTSEISRQLRQLRASQIVLETAPRVARPGPAAIGFITAEGLGLARQIDDLEREQNRVSNSISACTRRSNTAQGDLSHVESHLNRLTSDFARLNCAASTIPF